MQTGAIAYGCNIQTVYSSPDLVLYYMLNDTSPYRLSWELVFSETLKVYQLVIRDSIISPVTSLPETSDVIKQESIKNLLNSIKIQNLPMVTKIPDYFMHSCRELVTADIRGLSWVTEIGHQVLVGTWNLRKLISCDSIPDEPHLDEIMTSKHSDVKKYKNHVFQNIFSFPKVYSIGVEFLRRCGLQDLWIHNLKARRPEGQSWNPTTQSSTWPTPPRTDIGVFFLENSNISYFRMTKVLGLDTIPHSFLHNCAVLKVVEIDSPNVMTFGGSFLSLAEDLKYFFISTMPKLLFINDSFMEGCTSIRAIDLGGKMPEVQNIGIRFLSDCHNLKMLNMTGFNKLYCAKGPIATNTKIVIDIDQFPMLCRYGNLARVRPPFCNTIVIYPVLGEIPMGRREYPDSSDDSDNHSESTDSDEESDDRSSSTESDSDSS
jgi:hypothetical protein